MSILYSTVGHSFGMKMLDLGFSSCNALYIKGLHIQICCDHLSNFIPSMQSVVLIVPVALYLFCFLTGGVHRLQWRYSLLHL